MTVEECAKLLAKIQLVDNRTVSPLVILDWMDYVGDLDFEACIRAVVEFRRTHSGNRYLVPGDIVQAVLAGHAPSLPPTMRDVDAERRHEQLLELLALAGVSEDEFDAHRDDVRWKRARFGRFLEVEA